MNKDKCQDCGYLSIRNPDTTQLEEATKPTRDTGQRYDGKEVFPECAMMNADIKGECHDRQKEFRSVITKERDCDEHTAWMPGFSPKEHLKMNILQREREQQRIFQEKMSALQREFSVPKTCDESGTKRGRLRCGRCFRRALPG